MEIKDAKWITDIEGNNESVLVTIDGQEWSVPQDLSNTYWAEIKKRVDAGTLTIADAD